MLQKTFSAIKKHKFITFIIILIAALGGYFAYGALNKTSSQTSYVLAAVEKGTLITSISGSGQVSASNQIDIKPKVSGDIVYLGAKNGQEVKTETLLAQINARDTQKAVRDAQDNLETAQLSMEKLNQPADQLSLLQAENSLIQAKETKQNTQDDLQKAYENGFNTLSNAFLDLPAIMAGLNDVIFGKSLSANSWNIDYYADAVTRFDEKSIQYRDSTYNTYNAARAAYDKNFDDYKSANRSSDTSVIESLINQTYDTTKKIAEAIKSTNNLIQFYEDKLTEHDLKPSTQADTHLSSLNSYTSKTNSHLLNLLSAQSTIKNDKDAIISADRTIAERTASLAKLQTGADPLDLRSQNLTIQQRQSALVDAKQKLADYYIRAPFDGIIATVSVKKGDSVSSATAIATLLTKQQIAEISLNEVDAAKIKTGQKTTLTFDAIDGLNISGSVADVDAIGTVSQGVVSYNVKISFDTQDNRVKPGMSVSASIITEVKQNTLYVPNSAIKTSNGSHYVEILDQAQSSALASISQTVTSLASPNQIPVEIGITDDTSTEIISGLSEGEEIITRTVTASNQTSSQTTAPSLFGNGTRNTSSGAGGNMFRAIDH
jgi:HlyD family secretion protein